ncbi:MAG TPA: glycosyltransferase family 39 protein, partial [bacterium]|nr:glycosyltransferase family 39 protein [bacterium]
MAKPSRAKTRKAPLKGKKAAGKIQGKAAVIAAPVAAAPFRLEFFFYLLVAWGVVMAGLFSLPNYNWLLPAANPFRGIPTAGFLWGGFLALVGLWCMVPRVPENLGDFSPLTARIWFWIFMVLGAFLRMNHPDQPVGGFWDDHYIVISDIRNILDYHQRPLLFPSGWREPLFPYVTAFLWALLPGAHGVFIDKLSATLFDMVTFWILYLTGKEIGGRRMGVVIMGMAAICKGFICPTIFGYGINTTVLGCALAFLFFLRLMKKPDLKHFLEWGAALGFGGYVYAPFRPWTPVLLGVVWLWVFADSKERRFSFPRVVLG